jgi:hypothetical protein
MKNQWVLGLALSFAATSALAQNFNTDISGEVTFATQKSMDRHTPLVHDPDLFGIREEDYFITPVVNFDISSEKLTLSGQGRSEGQWNEDGEELEGTIDELFAEYTLTPDIFVFAGRRNIAFGQAESSFVLDVFLDPFEINRTKNVNRQRREVVGEDMAGFEALLNPEVSISGYYLPEQDKDDEGMHDERSLATLSWLLPWNAETELLVLDDERSGIGASYLQTVGEALLLYVEGMRRDGRDRERITDQGRREPDSGDFGQYILGGKYTFENSLGLTAEYYHNENGYSAEEWDSIDDMITTHNANIASPDPRLRFPAIGGLLTLNSTLRHFNLHQDYGFVRLSHPEFFGLPITSDISTFHNIDDDSGTLSTRFETDLGPGTAGLRASSAYGDDMGEFKLRSPNQSVMIYYTLGF